MTATAMPPDRSGASAERYAVALHEAGHAVAAVVLRLGLVSVTVVPTDQYRGRCTVVHRPRSRDTVREATAARGVYG